MFYWPKDSGRPACATLQCELGRIGSTCRFRDNSLLRGGNERLIVCLSFVYGLSLSLVAARSNIRCGTARVWYGYVAIDGVLRAERAAAARLHLAGDSRQIRSHQPYPASGREIGIDESQADEITAYLRPNPDLTAGIDQLNFFSTQTTPSGGQDAYRPFAFAFPSASLSYLYERRHKRELRRESAQKGTAIAESQLADQERNLLFNLRSAFVQTLQQKAVVTPDPG